MSYLTRPSNVRVYQFRQPPGSSRLILPKPHCAGTRGKTRTRNLLIRSQALYPLSYAGAHPWYGTHACQVRFHALSDCDVSLVVQSPGCIADQTDCTVTAAAGARLPALDCPSQRFRRGAPKLGKGPTHGVDYVGVGAA
jgi:hypothetical protein